MEASEEMKQMKRRAAEEKASQLGLQLMSERVSSRMKVEEIRTLTGLSWNALYSSLDGKSSLYTLCLMCEALGLEITLKKRRK